MFRRSRSHYKVMLALTTSFLAAFLGSAMTHTDSMSLRCCTCLCNSTLIVCEIVSCALTDRPPLQNILVTFQSVCCVNLIFRPRIFFPCDIPSSICNFMVLCLHCHLQRYVHTLLPGPRRLQRLGRPPPPANHRTVCGGSSLRSKAPHCW